jgi:predicted alpha/beta superfamily hydrolase
MHDKRDAMFGTVETHLDFPSRHVAPRRIDVWLPPHELIKNSFRLPVLYLHDGQNLFSPQTAFIRADWGMDDALRHLALQGRPAMAVGIWNTPQRLLEYLPYRPLARIIAERIAAGKMEPREAARSDAYLQFITEELKPFIDRRFPSHPDTDGTFIMGSSMGALFSLYALCERPEVFGGAACLSTHWPAVGEVILDYLAAFLPAPRSHRIYFDHGTETIDAAYEPYQHRVDDVMRRAGYTEGKNWLTLKFEGAEHSETAWRERVHIPLAFLLEGRETPSCTGKYSRSTLEHFP